MPKMKTLDQRKKELGLVSIRMIADHLKVQTNTVHVWRSRYHDFPAPYVIIDEKPLWLIADVEAWHTEHERKKGR